MGKWDRRRRFYRQRAPPSPPRYDLDERLPDFHEDGVPLWEKKFCTVVGRVPWRKIVDTQSFMQYTHGNVLSWDDSAGKQAFQNAKCLYWAKINCMSSDVSLPDLDIYIDKINWNPDIDPELIKDLEREYFVPDDEEKESDEEHKNRMVQNSLSLPSEENDRNSETADNPFVSGSTPDRSALKGKDGWGKWDDEIHDSRDTKNNGDPWDYNCNQKNEIRKHKTWGDCSDDNKWGPDKGYANQSRDWGTPATNWNRDYKDGWGSWPNHSGGWKKQDQDKLDNRASPWKSNVGRESSTFWNKGRGDGDRNPMGSRQQGNHNVRSRSFHSRQTNKDQHAQGGGCRKRDSSYQYACATDQRNFRPRHDYDQAGHYQGGKPNKKVSFSLDHRMR